jgi:uncharacterized membrane protein
MKSGLSYGGTLVGALGGLVCLVAGLARVMGLHYVAGYESMTLFAVGTAMMVAGCLAKLHTLGIR